MKTAQQQRDWIEKHPNYVRDWKKKNRVRLLVSRKKNDEIYRTGLKGKFQVLKYGAKRRNIEVFLTFDEYCILVYGQKCFWCGSELPKCGGSLDRLDNCKGYAKDNVVPSCTACNLAKKNVSVIEFLAWVKMIHDKHLADKVPDSPNER